MGKGDKRLDAQTRACVWELLHCLIPTTDSPPPNQTEENEEAVDIPMPPDSSITSEAIVDGELPPLPPINEGSLVPVPVKHAAVTKHLKPMMECFASMHSRVAHRGSISSG